MRASRKYERERERSQSDTGRKWRRVESQQVDTEIRVVVETTTGLGGRRGIQQMGGTNIRPNRPAEE